MQEYFCVLIIIKNEQILALYLYKIIHLVLLNFLGIKFIKKKISKYLRDAYIYIPVNRKRN